MLQTRCFRFGPPPSRCDRYFVEPGRSIRQRPVPSRTVFVFACGSEPRGEADRPRSGLETASGGGTSMLRGESRREKFGG